MAESRAHQFMNALAGWSDAENLGYTDGFTDGWANDYTKPIPENSVFGPEGTRTYARAYEDGYADGKEMEKTDHDRAAILATFFMGDFGSEAGNTLIEYLGGWTKVQRALKRIHKGDPLYQWAREVAEPSD